MVEDELGSSDHLAVSIQKYSKELNNKPKTIRKRSYKYFNKEDFIREIQYTDFSSVTNEYDINTAAEAFSTIFNNVFNNHAPIKIFQNRKNYAPWLCLLYTSDAADE